MFVILLRFSTNRNAVSQWLDAHMSWLQQGFAHGVFIASGSIRERQGGAILAHGLDVAALHQRVSEDPFVAHDVVSVEIIDIELSKTEPGLDFLIEERV
jgi:uncharacterized protein YciI